MYKDSYIEKSDCCGIVLSGRRLVMNKYFNSEDHPDAVGRITEHSRKDFVGRIVRPVSLTLFLVSKIQARIPAKSSDRPKFDQWASRVLDGHDASLHPDPYLLNKYLREPFANTFLRLFACKVQRGRSYIRFDELWEVKPKNYIEIETAAF